MEFQTISGVAIAGTICSAILSVGVPLALLIFAKKKYQAKLSSFFIGAGTFLLFAMVLEQLMHLLVFQVGGLSPENNRWLYYIYAAMAAAVFEETGRLVAMKFLIKKNLNFSNALMYGIGHGGIEAILLGCYYSISNLATMLMINNGTIQQSIAVLSDDVRSQTIEKVSALCATPVSYFYAVGVERIGAIILQIGLSLLIYQALKCKKSAAAVAAYMIHFAVDFFAVSSAAYLPIWVIEVCVYVMAIATLLLALKLTKNEPR